MYRGRCKDLHMYRLRRTKTETIKATGHAYDEGTVTKEATCTEKGVKTHTCKKNCGETKTSEIPAKGHSYDDGVVTKEATCTEDGIKTTHVLSAARQRPKPSRQQVMFMMRVQ